MRHSPSNHPQFYVTAPQDCPYLENNVEPKQTQTTSPMPLHSDCSCQTLPSHLPGAMSYHCHPKSKNNNSIYAQWYKPTPTKSLPMNLTQGCLFVCVCARAKNRLALVYPAFLPRVVCGKESQHGIVTQKNQEIVHRWKTFPT